MKIKIFTTTVATLMCGFFGPGARAAENPALMPPVKSVYGHYLKIQTELAKDSLQGVAAEAGAIAKAVEGDSMKMLPAHVAAQAKTLAGAKNLRTARAAFKPLSESLIKYLADHKVIHGPYVEVYCPMAKAGWLQADQNVKNPYMGKAMLDCGVVKK
jgi:Protein of unknown function (DUF3347)